MGAMISSDPNVMMGKPVIAGTRITVEPILEKLAAGESMAQIIASHPRLTEEAIRAALAFASEALKADVVLSVIDSSKVNFIAVERVNEVLRRQMSRLDRTRNGPMRVHIVPMQSLSF